MSNTASLSVGTNVYFLKDGKAVSGKIVAFVSKGSEHTPYTLEYSDNGIKKSILRSNTGVYMSSSEALKTASDKEQEKEGDTDIAKEKDAAEAKAKQSSSKPSVPVPTTTNSSTTSPTGQLRRRSSEESFKEELSQKLNTKLFEALMSLKKEISSKIINGEKK